MKFAKTLSRDEMRNVMAGNIESPCYDGSDNEGFCQQTGCEARFDSSGTCEGSDGCSYSNAKPC